MRHYSIQWMAHIWRSWRRWVRSVKGIASPLILPPWASQCQRLQDQMAILEARMNAMETLQTANPTSPFPSPNEPFEQVPDAHLGAQ